MINKDKAERMVLSIKDKEIACTKYLGIEKAPYGHIKTPYVFFPKELSGKEVHVFEGLSSELEEVSVALCQYYIDYDGNVYKDTYPQDGKCIKVK